MKKDTLSRLENRIEIGQENPLHDLVREGARRMIQAAIKAEVSEYIEARATALDEGAVV